MTRTGPGQRRSAALGLLVGAAAGLVMSLGHRMVLVMTGYFDWLSSEASKVGTVWFEVWFGLITTMISPMGHATFVVMPTVAGGGLAGFVIGALVQGPLRRRGRLGAWWTGMLVCCLGVAVAVAQWRTGPDFVWSSDAIPLLWIPWLIFVGTGGAIALWLHRRVRRSATSVHAST